MTREILTNAAASWVEYSNRIEHEDKCRSMMEQPGNPMGIIIEKFGHATAVGSKVLGGSTNRAMDVGTVEVKFIDTIIRFFELHGMEFRFDITPYDCNDELFAKLTERGFAQTGFHTVLYGEPLWQAPAYPDGVTVRQVREDEFGLYADLYVRSFGMPEWTKEGVAENNRLLSLRPGRSFYIAEVDGVPAGIAGLFIEESMANLSVAGTLPEFRGRGCHLALLQHRMYVAGQEEFEHTMVGQASFASTSMKNMQRAGLQVAYTKSIWTRKRPSQ